MFKETNLQSLGEYIESRRLARGYSLTQAAERSGLHYSYWSKLENGLVQTPSPRHLKTIATTLKVPVEDLYGLAGYDLPDRLPAFKPYLRAKYELPPEAIADLEKYFAQLRAYYGIPDDQPVFPPKPKPQAADQSETNGDKTERAA
jgi:transcriptional regulator with XRE-family HTH domain